MENEKLTYINSRGERLELGVDSVYHCNISKDVEGISGVTSVIYSTNSMGQHGDTYVGQRIEARDIDVVGHINTRDKAQALELRRRMLKIFNPELSATLVYEYGGFKRVIDCRAYGEPKILKKEVLYEFDLQIECLNPFWREEEETKEDIASWVAAWHFPCVIEKDSTKSMIYGYRAESVIVDCYNEGDVSTGMRIRFTALGTVSNPILLNVDTEEFIQINATMKTGDVIEINTKYGSKGARLLVDDVTKTDARALLNVNKMATISDIVAPSNEYIYASGANELTVVEGCVIAVGGAGIFKTANTILTAANLDAGSAFAVGKDYYVYICDSRIDSADEKYVISLNSTYPTGWNATNSRKIGGFHYGRCRKVDSNLQPLNGSSVIFGTGWESAVSNGIVPRSVWTLGHRPKCSPEGMVYLGGGTWVDIYLNSDDGAKGLKSEYGCAPMTGTESMNWYNFVERLAKSGKRLPNYAEFCAYAFGSPAGLDNANTNAWSAASNTGRGVTGSVVNAVSSVGVVDAVGRVWEWLDELITRAEHATNADYHASVAWGWDKKSPLNTAGSIGDCVRHGFWRAACNQREEI